MVTKTDIGTSTAIILAIAAIVMGSGLIGQDNVYACEQSQIAMQCESLSKINADGIQTRCYYTDEIENKTRYKNCKSGWLYYEVQKTETIKTNFSKENPIYLLCEKTNKLIGECSIIDDPRLVSKVELS